MESIFDNGAAVNRAHHGDNAVEGTNKIREVVHYRASHGVNIMCCATKSLKESAIQSSSIFFDFAFIFNPSWLVNI